MGQGGGFGVSRGVTDSHSDSHSAISGSLGNVEPRPNSWPAGFPHQPARGCDVHGMTRIYCPCLCAGDGDGDGGKGEGAISLLPGSLSGPVPLANASSSR